MYPPQHAGGYELVWQRAMQHARELGYEVRILVSDYVGGSGQQEIDPDVHRTLRLYWDLEKYEFPRLTGWQRLELERHNTAQLSRHLDEFQPDVVSFWSMGCMSLSLIEHVRRRRLPMAFIVHDDWLVYGRRHDQWVWAWDRRRWRRIARPLVALACGVPTQVNLEDAGSFIFNSRYTLERARKAGLSARRMAVVYPGIDERFYQHLPAHPWGWRLLYVGRLDRQKGVDTAVEALAHLPPTATLSIWGTGDERYIAEMAALARRIGAADRVRFEGFASPDHLLAAYEEADAVLFPARWQEPFGLVPLEAMGLGRPVVSTAQGGSAEYLQHEANSLIIGAGDAEALAGAVVRLAQDEPLRARLQEGGSRTAARYPAHKFAHDTVQKIAEAIPVGSRVASADPAS